MPPTTHPTATWCPWPFVLSGLMSYVWAPPLLPGVLLSSALHQTPSGSLQAQQVSLGGSA